MGSGKDLFAGRIIGGRLWGAAQPDHTLALAGFVAQAGGNAGRMLTARAIELVMGSQCRGQATAFGILADLLTDRLGDAGLVQHQVGGLQGAQGVQSQKARGVGVGMHHDDLALSGGLAIQLAGQLGLGGRDVSLGHQGVKAAGEQGFPEVASLAHGAQLFLHPGAPAASDVGQGAGVLRQQGLDALTPVPDQHG